MHILMVGGLVPWHPDAGGGQVIAYKVAEAIARAGHEIDYVATAPENSRRQIDWGKFIYVPEKDRFLTQIQRGLHTRELNAYDIIHVHAAGDTLGQYIGHIIQQMRHANYKLALGIYTPQAYGFPRSPDEAGWMSLCRAADSIFSLSKFSKRNIAQAYRISPSKITVMYGGVDECFFLPRETRDTEPHKLLFCGRLAGRPQGRRQQKGVDILLRALPAIIGSHPVKLEIVGQGPLSETFKSLARDLRVEAHVEFAGFVEYEQIARQYAKANLFILPSRRESFGLVAAEAMAAGLPVVATHVGAIPEVVQDNVTGILVPPENPTALAQAINGLLSDPSRMETMGTTGRERVRAHFTWDQAAQRVLDAYRRILST